MTSDIVMSDLVTSDYVSSELQSWAAAVSKPIIGGQGVVPGNVAAYDWLSAAVDGLMLQRLYIMFI